MISIAIFVSHVEKPWSLLTSMVSQYLAAPGGLSAGPKGPAPFNMVAGGCQWAWNSKKHEEKHQRTGISGWPLVDLCMIYDEFILDSSWFAGFLMRMLNKHHLSLCRCSLTVTLLSHQTVSLIRSQSDWWHFKKHLLVYRTFLLRGWLIGGAAINKKHKQKTITSFEKDTLTKLSSQLVQC